MESLECNLLGPFADLVNMDSVVGCKSYKALVLESALADLGATNVFNLDFRVDLYPGHIHDQNLIASGLHACS
jgi:hypothetical protein